MSSSPFDVPFLAELLTLFVVGLIAAPLIWLALRTDPNVVHDDLDPEDEP